MWRTAFCITTARSPDPRTIRWSASSRGLRGPYARGRGKPRHWNSACPCPVRLPTLAVGAYSKNHGLAGLGRSRGHVSPHRRSGKPTRTCGLRPRSPAICNGSTGCAPSVLHTMRMHTSPMRVGRTRDRGYRLRRSGITMPTRQPSRANTPAQRHSCVLRGTASVSVRTVRSGAAEALLGRPGTWTRVASFRPFRLPGGERCAREPWRTALALWLGIRP